MSECLNCIKMPINDCFPSLSPSSISHCSSHSVISLSLSCPLSLSLSLSLAPLFHSPHTCHSLSLLPPPALPPSPPPPPLSPSLPPPLSLSLSLSRSLSLSL